MTHDNIYFRHFIGDFQPTAKELAMGYAALVGRPGVCIEHVLLVVGSDNRARRGHQRERRPATTTTNIEHTAAAWKRFASTLMGWRIGDLPFHREHRNRVRPGLGFRLRQDFLRDRPGIQVTGPRVGEFGHNGVHCHTPEGI